MRILYFHQHFTLPTGSSGTRSYELAKALVQAGHSVTMICGEARAGGLDCLPRDASRQWKRGTVDGIDVIALPVPYSNHDGIAKRALLFLRFALRSIRLALSEPCDLVFATSTPLTAALPGIAARWLRKKPFVFEVRDLWPELPRALGMKNPLLLGGMSLLEWMAYRSCHAAVGLSPGIVEGIRKRSREHLPVVMIPNGCDLELFRPDLRGPLTIDGVQPGDFVAGFTGAHGVANGLDAALDAARVLLDRGARHIKLLFVGDGKVKDALAKRAAEERLSNCLFFPPMPKSELARLTASLGCGLMLLKNVPAFYNGTSPNKFFDYLSAGIPILVNYPGWMAGLVRENDCGMAVAPDNPPAFADALLELAGQPDQNQQCGRNARRLGEARFNRKDQSAAFVKFLESTFAATQSG